MKGFFRSKLFLSLAAMVMVLLLAGAISLTSRAHAASASSEQVVSSGAGPDWARNPRIDAAGDLVVRLLNGSLTASSRPSHQGTACAAEPSATGNVQVNCLA